MAAPFNSYSFYNGIIAGKLWDYECATFRGLHAIASLVGQVLSCHCAFVGRKYFFVGPKFFFGGYFMGAKFILVGISCVPYLFSWVFRGP